jgi:uncharacterized protein (TIGR03437 family)
MSKWRIAVAILALGMSLAAQTYTVSTVVTGAFSAGGVAVDSAGNIYYGNGQALMKMTATGAVTIYAGNVFTAVQSTGDGGPASGATFNTISRMFVDSQNNLYIRDNDRLRKITTATGIITTVAGGGTSFTAPAAGGVSSSSLSFRAGGNPPGAGFFVDGAGNIFLSWNDAYVLKISGGTATVFAGNGANPANALPGDGVAATSVPLDIAQGVAVDGAGNVYISEDAYDRIRKVTPGGIASTIAGSGGTPGFSGDGGAATSAKLFNPEDVALDGAGNIYIADSDNNRVRKMSGGVIATIAGGGTNSSTSFVGAATDFKFPTFPISLAVGADGTIFVGLFGGNVVKLAPIAVAPAINAGGIVNGASFSTTQPPAAGSIGSLFGANLASQTVVATTLPLPTSLGGVSVTVNGVLAPLFFVSAAQINFMFPWEVLGLSQVPVIVTTTAGASPAVTVSLASTGPGIFTINSSGSGQGAIQIANTATFAAPSGSIQGASAQPVARGQFITVYCSGLGAVQNPPATGTPASGQQTTSLPAMTIGGVSVTPSFAGLAPGFVGLYQVNAQVPQNVALGSAVPVVITASGVASNSVTIAVQ